MKEPRGGSGGRAAWWWLLFTAVLAPGWALGYLLAGIPWWLFLLTGVAWAGSALAGYWALRRLDRLD